MELYERLRAALPDCTFRPPATEEQVRRVERDLGIVFPDEVRRLYLHCDGVHGGMDVRVVLLPLVSPDCREAGGESVLSWNQFRHSPGWEQGYEPPTDVLEIGFLNDDEYVGVDLRTGGTVVVYRRGNEVEPVDEDLCDLLAREYREQRRFTAELDKHVFDGRVAYFPVKAGEGTQRDIDRVVTAVLDAHPGQFVQKELAGQPDEPGGTWVVSVGYEPNWEQIRLRSATGDCPFIVESDVSGTTAIAATAEQAASMVGAELERYWREWRHRNGL